MSKGTKTVVASKNAKNVKTNAKNVKTNTRKAIAPDATKGDTRPRVVAKENVSQERALIAQLEKARAAGDRKAGKKIRRALRKLGHWGGLRLASTVASA